MSFFSCLYKARGRVRNRYRRAISELFVRRLVELSHGFPAISFTFDDFPRSALLTGGAILERYGLTGTYYASLGLIDRDSPVGRIFSASDLGPLVAQGHELGCHTFAHCHAWETEASAFEDSIIENRRALDRLLPGAVFRTLSYPISCPSPETKRRAAKHFGWCRSGSQDFNTGRVDLNSLGAFFLEQCGEDSALVKRLIDRNSQASGWLIFATHDVSKTPSKFGCTPEFFEEIVAYAVRSGSRIMPVAKAWELMAGGRQVDKQI